MNSKSFINKQNNGLMVGVLPSDNNTEIFYDHQGVVKIMLGHGEKGYHNLASVKKDVSLFYECISDRLKGDSE